MSLTDPLEPGPSPVDVRSVARASSRRRPVDPYRNALVVHGYSYTFWWCLVLSLQSITAIFVLCMGFVHVALSHPVVHANTPSLQLSISLKRVSGLSYLFIAMLHLRGVWTQLRHTITARQLTMRPSTGSTQSQKTLTISRDINAVPSMFRRLEAATQLMFGAAGAFGINGRFFSLAVVVREVVEIGLQTYQLWCLSRSVSRAWINDFAVITVVMNCLSIPVVHAVFRSRERMRRLMHLVVDMYLDFVCAIVIPVCVMVPYLLLFDWSIGSFPLSALADEIWLSNAIAEGLQVLVTSYTDLLSSLLPQYSIYACLRILKRLIVRRVPVGSKRPLAAHRSRIVVPFQSAVSDLTMQTNSVANRRERRGVQIIGSLVAAWGLSVLILHIKATLNASQDPSCRLHLRPWFVSHVACSVLIINCSTLNLTGTREQTAGFLTRYERPILSRVTFASCAELTVPPEIVAFSFLSSITIRDSTVVSWSSDAAIRTSTHPRLDSLWFSGSHFDEIPPAIYHRELPGLFTVGFQQCSLDQLPDDIGDVWGHGALSFLQLEGAQLRSIPESMGAMALRRLIVTDSLVEELPDDLLTRFQLMTLHLSRNPLQRLPPSIGDTTCKFSRVESN